jgi:hypothetical protein
MSSNVIVDTAKLNEALQRLDKLFSAASKGTVYIGGVGAGVGTFHTLLNVSSANNVKMEATIIKTSAAATRTGNRFKLTYPFKTDFAHMPVVTATYDGPGDVNIRVDVSNGSGKDSIDVYLKKNGTTANFKDEFNVHIIAIGN